MTLIGPILDDRSYEDLKQELLKRIPVYAPEWTDHNETDPGVVLLELFAYLGESLLFRFNQIPDATKVAFLRLLGLRPRPARTARALVSLRTERVEGVHLNVGAEVTAGPIVFETSNEVHAWPLEVQAYGKMPPDDPAQLPAAEKSRRADAEARLPQAERARVARFGKAFYEVHAVPADPLDAEAHPLDVEATVDRALWIAVLARTAQQRDAVAKQLPSHFLYVGVVLDNVPAAPPAVEPDADPLPRATVAEPPAVLWELWQGGTSLVPLDVAVDGTRGLTEDGVVQLGLPAADLPPTGQDEPVGGWDRPPQLDDPAVLQRAVAWLRVRRPAGENDIIGRVRWAGINVVAVENGQTARAELLGTGTGDPGQTYALSRRPVLPGTVRLQVEEVDGWHDWTEVDTFAAGRPENAWYTVDLTAGLIRFGTQTRVPQPGQRIRVLSYRVGGGVAGNVAAGAITAVTGAAGVKASNILPAAGGADAASLADALDQIPAEVQRRDRAVTAEDFRALTAQVPGVRRAEPLPLLHPDTPGHPAAGVVSVVVFPTDDLRNPDAPSPDTALLRRVAAYLEPRRVLTCEVYVIPPAYRPIAVSVGVRVREGYQADAVRRWVELILRQYLSPVPPYGPDGQGWTLGRTVRRAELEAVAVQVDGVESIEQGLRLARVDGANAVEVQEVELRRWEVPELRAVTVVRGAPPAPGAGYPPSGPGSDPEPPVLIPLPAEVC
ncbi:putative baseplate assembly protein [Micromonospora soli]|uniref:putative baseplate assembly protein n=1 Tax=Micromonospora sp. NBRC 110009 TaxID=3061627 RepID=UPI0026711F6C|nr:putative baseplate assembly protein [Micromonospora sp. NBRC 110009]WKT96869.1 putative baseplate assembly protein [Micromonospora sp. NBRC 110009]